MHRYNSAAVFHLNGQFMFYCDLRRANWYLNKNLATVRTQTPNRLEIQLTFEPKGIGPNDEFSNHEIQQRCVVCGSIENLTKHHIVPSCYRKHFSNEYKSRINHDVAIVCESHHHVYEDFANILKDQLAKKHNVPTTTECAQLQAPTSNPLLKKHNVIRSLCVAYIEGIKKNNVSEKLRDKLRTMSMDPEKVDLLKILKENDEQIRIIQELSQDFDHGQLLVSKLKDVDKFIKMWRKHFIDTMEPQFMPHGWSIDYKTKVIKPL